ncbi:MAG TPA: HAMP domain-containing sensor histidine kinase [Longimicrobiaceae bacterium]|nr:HAMP domain-containing sensor histidine kinase [Longimicrobiaceae bacterium]
MQISPFRPPRRPVLAVLLALVLVIAGALAFRAEAVARYHRATAERTVRDYAGFAAYLVGSSTGRLLNRELGYAFHPVDLAMHASAGALPPPAVLAADTAEFNRCRGALPAGARYWFRLDLRTGALATTGASVSPALARWLRAGIRPAEYRAGWLFAFLFGAPEGRPQQVIYTLREAPDGGAVVYGFNTCFRADGGSSVFRLAEQQAQALPPTLAGETPNDSLLSIVVADTAGAVLYRSPVQYAAEFAGRHALREQFTGLVVTVHLRPDLLPRLVIGGLPRSRLPLALGLLGVTAVLLAAALFQLRREHELVRLREGFVADVSHELRTPLQQVLLFVELLRLRRLARDDERERALEIVEQETRRLIRLVDNVLQFSRLGRREHAPARAAVALAPLARETAAAFAPLARSAGAEVRLELDERAAVHADANDLRQVLLNFLDNAVKYGPPGQAVTLAVARRDGAVEVRVDDQGPGIPATERGRVWSAFYRLPREAEAATAGSGIGLAIVRELVARSGGRVRVEDAPGGGARFVASFPALEAAP